MTVDVSKIYLLDVATGGSVEAELRDAIEQAQLDDWQTKWRPALLTVLQELARRGVPMDQWPQSWHWDWTQKTTRVQGLLAAIKNVGTSTFAVPASFAPAYRNKEEETPESDRKLLEDQQKQLDGESDQ